MKNQYFGDVNDYRKYGLLRGLLTGSDLTLSVVWMLTPDDGGPDGGRRAYLAAPCEWRRHDAELFDFLSGALTAGVAPAVALIESSGILPRAGFFSGPVPDQLAGRLAWRERARVAASGADLVFLDPDKATWLLARAGRGEYGPVGNNILAVAIDGASGDKWFGTSGGGGSQLAASRRASHAAYLP